MEINISDMPEGKSFEDYPDDTIFVHKDITPRYILRPFEIIPPEDTRYQTALTREEIEKQ